MNSTTETSPYCTDSTCIFYAVTNTIIFALGIPGNGLVIWITGFKMKKSVVTTWYLSLATSDLVFCSTLVFGVIQKVQKRWIFGLFMCKFRYFVKYLNMYSSIFLLTIISVDRCITVRFPVWAQNQRTARRASVIVVITWIISAALSLPSFVFREIVQSKGCSNRNKSVARVASRFVFGFVIPFHVIVICYVAIMRKLKSSQMAKSKKPFKIMTVLIFTFLICWLPFHVFSFLEVYKKSNLVPKFKMAKKVGIFLANANSFFNPFLYAFMGKNIKKSCHTVHSKIENAIQEESQYRLRGAVNATSMPHLN